MAKKQSMTDVYLAPGFDLPSDYSALTKIYRTLAKTADQRLVRLEGYRHEQNFKVADKWAYARAMRDIQAWSGEEATRFNTKPPASVAQLQAKIQDIKTFLLSPSSTKQGIIKMYQKRANTINAKYGTNFKWDEIGTFFESEAWQQADEKFASESAMTVLATIYKNKEKIVEGIKKANAVNIKAPDKMEEALVNRFLKENGAEVLEAFEKLR